MAPVILRGLAAIALLVALTFWVVVFLHKRKHERRQYFDTVRSLLRFRQLEEHSGGQRLPDLPAGTEGENLAELLGHCLELAEQIDRRTGNPGTSERVAWLALRLAEYQRLPQLNRLLYFGAALVHDAGFLDLDPSLFRGRRIDEEAFETLKTHTQLAAGRLDFVPPDWRAVFLDAVRQHHENLDGSGYPDGLRSRSISHVARTIRVAESYIALVSRRRYRRKRSSLAAVGELRAMKSRYDQDLVNALEHCL